MSSGIFGPRAPSYPNPSNYQRSFQASYGLSSYTPNPNSYTPKMSYRHQPQSVYPQTIYTSPAYGQYAYPQQYPGSTQIYSNSPYPTLPAYPIGPQSLPYFSNSQYLSVLPYAGNTEHGLDAILIAILVLVSLDLIFVRPLKRTSE